MLTNSSDGGSYGNVNISGGKAIDFSAPASGDDMEGVVFYQDRNAPASSSGNGITGTADIKLDGTAYFPSREFTIGGNANSASDLTDPCSRIIAKTVVLHGNPRLGNNCDDSAAETIGSASVSLVQ